MLLLKVFRAESGRVSCNFCSRFIRLVYWCIRFPWAKSGCKRAFIVGVASDECVLGSFGSRLEITSGASFSSFFDKGDRS